MRSLPEQSLASGLSGTRQAAPVSGPVPERMDDDQSVARLFLQQREMLLSYIRALVRDPDDAEDLFQEVGVCVLRLEQMPCGRDKFAAWCRGVARNLILQYWRLRRRRPIVTSIRLLDVFDLAYTEADLQNDQTTQRSLALEQCVAQLPERRRHVLSLFYLRGMTSEQIGAVLQRSAEAVRQELTRLRHRLLDCIERRLAKDLDCDG